MENFVCPFFSLLAEFENKGVAWPSQVKLTVACLNRCQACERDLETNVAAEDDLGCFQQSLTLVPFTCGFSTALKFPSHCFSWCGKGSRALEARVNRKTKPRSSCKGTGLPRYAPVLARLLRRGVLCRFRISKQLRAGQRPLPSRARTPSYSGRRGLRCCRSASYISRPYSSPL